VNREWIEAYRPWVNKTWHLTLRFVHIFARYWPIFKKFFHLQLKFPPHLKKSRYTTLWLTVYVLNKSNLLQLMQSKCIRTLLYVLDGCPLNKADINSLDFVINQFFYQIVLYRLYKYCSRVWINVQFYVTQWTTWRAEKELYQKIRHLCYELLMLWLMSDPFMYFSICSFVCLFVSLFV